MIPPIRILTFLLVALALAPCYRLHPLYEITGESPEGFLWQRRYIIVSNDNPEKMAQALFVQFFNSASYAVPTGVEVLGAVIESGILVLDVSANILHFGGNANEHALVMQILKNAASLPGINSITLLTEGRLGHLPEGRIVYRHNLY